LADLGVEKLKSYKVYHVSDQISVISVRKFIFRLPAAGAHASKLRRQLECRRVLPKLGEMIAKNKNEDLENRTGQT
jgi:hypothetical protein